MDSAFILVSYAFAEFKCRDQDQDQDQDLAHQGEEATYAAQQG
jgi:hypothetical protein